MNCYCMVPTATVTLSYETYCLRDALFLSYDDNNDHHQTDVTDVSVDKQLTYLLTPLSRVLLGKLTGSAASQEIPRTFGT